MVSKDSAVGFFDSGKGGLCILDAFRRLLPNENTIYFGDVENCPYGNKSADEITARAIDITGRLLALDCKEIVVACNTATAAAIETLRARWPNVPFVGMEPAVKPAALRSKSGVVGVLATKGTFNGRLYRETSARFAKDVNVLMCTADEFVTLVERGKTDGPEVERAVRSRIEPLLAAGADYLVLGCTHFPHLTGVMERVAAGRAKIIEPSVAVAARAKFLLEDRNLLRTGNGVAESRILFGHW